MDGKELIEKICNRLEKKNIMLYDSQIVKELSSITRHELYQLIKGNKK